MILARVDQARNTNIAAVSEERINFPYGCVV